MCTGQRVRARTHAYIPAVHTYVCVTPCPQLSVQTHTCACARPHCICVCACAHPRRTRVRSRVVRVGQSTPCYPSPLRCPCTQVPTGSDTPKPGPLPGPPKWLTALPTQTSIIPRTTAGSAPLPPPRQGRTHAEDGGHRPGWQDGHRRCRFPDAPVTSPPHGLTPPPSLPAGRHHRHSHAAGPSPGELHGRHAASATPRGSALPQLCAAHRRRALRGRARGAGPIRTPAQVLPRARGRRSTRVCTAGNW